MRLLEYLEKCQSNGYITLGTAMHGISKRLNNSNFTKVMREFEYLRSNHKTKTGRITDAEMLSTIIPILQSEEYNKQYLAWEHIYLKNDWIPVSSGNLPEEFEEVHVTYIRHDNGEPCSNAFAYYYDNKWYWAIYEEEVKVKITAWRPMHEPYRED